MAALGSKLDLERRSQVNGNAQLVPRVARVAVVRLDALRLEAGKPQEIDELPASRTDIDDHGIRLQQSLQSLDALNGQATRPVDVLEAGRVTALVAHSVVLGVEPLQGFFRRNRIRVHEPAVAANNRPQGLTAAVGGGDFSCVATAA